MGISPKGVGVFPTDTRKPTMSETMRDQFQDMVCAEVRERRGMGLKAAFLEVARFFGLSERRVRACWNGEIRAVLAHEWEAVRGRRIEAVRRRQAALAHQLMLLGETEGDLQS